MVCSAFFAPSTTDEIFHLFFGDRLQPFFYTGFLRMKAGIISDTHLADPLACRHLAASLLASCFADVDLILHAGDIGNPELLFHFAPLDVLAVGGNTDTPHDELPGFRTIGIEGSRVGLVHGWGGSSGLESRLQAHFAEKTLDVLIFGHSHTPVCRKTGGLLLFNPGSPTQPRSASGPTVGLINFNHGKVTGNIISCRDLI
jgi:putative phosphoesterase